MDPATGLLYCDQCGTAVDEHDPNENGPNTHGGDEKLTRFNNETQPIRDALKAIEGITVPSVNIIAWIAQNVKQAPLPGQAAAEEENKKKYQVVIGDEGDERERIEKARLAEAQRCVWDCFFVAGGSG
jgi:transcription initiation factor TFIIE subunit alpha